MGPICRAVRREVGIPVSSAWGFGAEPQIGGPPKMRQGRPVDLVMVGKSAIWPTRTGLYFGCP